VFVTRDTVHHPRRFVFGKFVRKPNCSWSVAFVNRGVTVYFVNLYMFRAYLGPSSGGTTVFMQQLVLIILFRWLSVVLVGLKFSIQPGQGFQAVTLPHVYCWKPFATIFTELLHSTTQWWVSYFYFLNTLLPGPRGVGLRPLTCWGCGFESHRRHGCLSVVSFVWCQVEVSAAHWSCIQRSPTDCDASSCVI